VDQRQQLEVLRKLRCDSCQGDLFAAPQPAGEVLRHVAPGAPFPVSTLSTLSTTTHSLQSNED
jgi:hypothetical protein